MVLVAFCAGETEFRLTTSLGHTILFIRIFRRHFLLADVCKLIHIPVSAIFVTILCFVDRASRRMRVMKPT
jgi:hypothetical protein